MLESFLTILPTPPAGLTPAGISQEAIKFFALWIGRVGGIVAFVGAIKFALGIKLDEAREMSNGLIIMVSGFMIREAVITGGRLNIFNAVGGAGADAEFTALTNYIGAWVGTLGAAVAFIGAVLFAFAMKDENAASKVTGLKTMAAGFVAAATAATISMFLP